MKKFLTVLAVLVVTFIGGASADDAIVWTEVSTATEFINAVKTKDASGNYTTNVKLTTNIDLSGQSFDGGTVFTDIEFRGRITGENPGGTDFYIKGTGKYEGCMLFSEVDDASFSHLILTNFKYTHDWYAEKRAILTAKSNNSTFEYITIRNSGVYNELAIL